MNFELIKAKYPPLIIEKDDRYIYYEVLDIAGISGDYEPFIKFIVEKEVVTLENYLEYLNNYSNDKEIEEEINTFPLDNDLEL